MSEPAVRPGAYAKVASYVNSNEYGESFESSLVVSAFQHSFSGNLYTFSLNGTARESLVNILKLIVEKAAGLFGKQPVLTCLDDTTALLLIDDRFLLIVCDESSGTVGDMWVVASRFFSVTGNGALNGVRTIVALIPEREIGVAVFANKQLTVFPEAVQAEFLERTLGPSGRDLQAQIHDEQLAWQSMVAVPKAPADAKPIGHRLDAFTGRFTSALFDSLEVVLKSGTLAVRIGPRNYPGQLAHWSGDTFLLTFDNPDVSPGLLTFEFQNAINATAINGNKIPGAFSTDHGHFRRIG